jgi:hypothetical protein
LRTLRHFVYKYAENYNSFVFKDSDTISKQSALNNFLILVKIFKSMDFSWQVRSSAVPPGTVEVFFSDSVYIRSEPYDGGMVEKKNFYKKRPIIQCDEGSVLKLSFILRFQANIAGVEIRMQNYGKKSKLPHRVKVLFSKRKRSTSLVFCHKMA